MEGPKPKKISTRRKVINYKAQVVTKDLFQKQQEAEPGCSYKSSSQETKIKKAGIVEFDKKIEWRICVNVRYATNGSTKNAYGVNPKTYTQFTVLIVKIRMGLTTNSTWALPNTHAGNKAQTSFFIFCLISFCKEPYFIFVLSKQINTG